MDLEGILDDAGITPVRSTSKEVWARCPKHKERTGKEDQRPSWSISTSNYAHHCFSCGYSGSLYGLLIDVTGSAPEDLEKTLATQGFLREMAQVRERAEEVVEDLLPTLTEWQLHNLYVDVPDRMLAFKHLQRAAIDAYEVRWDREAKRWVMPVRTPDGNLIGAQYRQKGSVLTLPEGMEKSKTLFGFPQCEQSNFVALVESPLDAVRLYGLGIPTVSSLGAWVSAEQATILARSFRRVYLAFDNPSIDKTGKKALEIVKPILKKAGTSVFEWDYTDLVDDEGEVAKDVGDVESDEALLVSWQRTLRMGL